MTKNQKIMLVILLLLVLGAIVYFVFFFKTVAQKKKILLDEIGKTDGQKGTDVINRMSDDEIATTYDYIVNYVDKKKTLDMSSALGKKVALIASKYGFFN